MEQFFDAADNLRPQAGPINWPWGDLATIERSNFDSAGKRMLADKVASFRNDRQGIVDNAFVYACMHGHVAAATFLLGKGASINAIPGGFDYSGTALHYAALNGRREMVDFLIERGADVRIVDTKVGGTAAGWAEYGGHPAIKALLERAAGA